MGYDAAKWLRTHVEQAEKAADYTQAKVDTDLTAYESDLESNRRAFQDIQAEAAAITQVLQGKRADRQKIAHSVREIGKIISNQLSEVNTMTDALNKFKAEMEKRGLFRKITVAANLIPPPPGLNPEALIAIHKLAAKEALIMYAQKHDDFSDLLAEAAFDNLFDTILTDDLFKPVEGFTPTDEERAKMEEAEKTAKALSGLFDILKNI